MLEIARHVVLYGETFERLVQHHAVVGELLQKTDLAGGGRDRHLIVLAHLLFKKRRDQFLGGLHAGQVHVEVVDVKEDDAAAIEWYRAFEVDRRSAARGGELALLITAGRDHFKAFNRARLAVDAQLEIFFRQSVDEVALLVENHHVGLDEFGVNAYNVILRFDRRCWLTRLGDGDGTGKQNSTERQGQSQDDALFPAGEHKQVSELQSTG